MIFISYSRTDKNIVYPLAKLLRASGQEIFLDVENLDFGSDWKSQLSIAIQKSERFLVFWSISSKISEVVQEEWRLALSIPGFKIIPVMLDKTPLPKELAPFHGTEDLAFIFASIKKIKAFKKILLITWIFAVLILSSTILNLSMKATNQKISSYQPIDPSFIKDPNTQAVFADSSRSHILRIIMKRDSTNEKYYTDTIWFNLPQTNDSSSKDTITIIRYSSDSNFNYDPVIALYNKTESRLSPIISNIAIGIFIFTLFILVYQFISLRKKRLLYHKAFRKIVYSPSMWI